MGKRGPLPKTEAENDVTGNPGKRKRKAQAVTDVLLTVLPRSPKHLGPIASYEWRRMGGALVSDGKLTSVNLKALEMYCLNYELFRREHETIREEKTVKTSGKGGHTMPHPAVGNMNKFQKEMLNWQKVLERTPAAHDKKHESELDKFLQNGGKPKVVKGGKK